MNTIEEIIKSKRRKTITEETLYETYKRDLCNRCANKKNTKELCRITITRDLKAKCDSYEKCMKKQCHGCDDENECFEKEK